MKLRECIEVKPLLENVLNVFENTSEKWKFQGEVESKAESKDGGESPKAVGSFETKQVERGS